MKLGKTYFSGSLTFDEGNNSIGPNTSNITGSFTGSLKGTLTATGDIIPSVSGAFDLGSTAFPFKDLYITQNSLKFVDQTTGTEIGRISVNSNTGDIKLLNTKNLTEEEKANLTAETAGAEALSPVSASALWVSQSIFAGHQNTNIGHEVAPFHTLYTQFISGSSATLTGDLTVGGKVTAQEFHTEFVSASIVYQSGSTQFGNSSDDIHEFTGSINTTGNLSVNTNALFIDSQNKRASIGGIGGDALSVFNSGYPLIKFIDGSTTRGLLGYVFDWGHYALQSEGDLAFRIGTSGGSLKMVLDTSGNLGVGTGSPLYKIDIVNDDSTTYTTSGIAPAIQVIRNTNTTAGSAAILQFRGANSNLWSLGLATDASTYGGSLVFQQRTGASSYAERMRITSDGKVGIGTTSPTEKLHLQNGVLLIDTNTPIGTGIWMPDTNGNPSLKIVLDSAAASDSSIVNNWGNASNPGVMVGTTRSSDGIAFQVRTGVTTTSGFATDSGTTRFIVLGNGNVGIGTTTPTNKLHVVGDDITTGLQITGGTNGRNVIIGSGGINFRTTTVYGWGMELMVSDNDGSNKLSNIAGAFGSAGSFSYTYYGGTAYNDAAIYIPSTKNVGLGTTSPAMKLTVRGGILALNSANGSSDSGLYISPTNENTLNSGYGADAENRDIWLNYRGYNDGFTRFRDVRIGNGKGNAFAFFQGSTQYIGFGTESPSAKFHVDNGGIKHTQLTGAGWMTISRFKIDQSSFSNPDIVLVSNAAKTGSYPQIAVYVKLNGRGVSANYAQFTQAYATVAVDNDNNLTDLKTANISHTTLGPGVGAGSFSISGGSLRFTPSRQTNYDGYSIEININSRDCTFDT